MIAGAARGAHVAQAGVQGYEGNFSLVMYAPKGTPDAVVRRTRDAMADALTAPDVVDKLKASDQVVVPPCRTNGLSRTSANDPEETDAASVWLLPSCRRGHICSN